MVKTEYNGILQVSFRLVLVRQYNCLFKRQALVNRVYFIDSMSCSVGKCLSDEAFVRIAHIYMGSATNVTTGGEGT